MKQRYIMKQTHTMKKLPSLKTFERYIRQADSYSVFNNTITIIKNNVKKEYPYSLFQQMVQSTISN
jgi:hypothetical protein